MSWAITFGSVALGDIRITPITWLDIPIFQRFRDVTVGRLLRPDEVPEVELDQALVHKMRAGSSNAATTK